MVAAKRLAPTLLRTAMLKQRVITGLTLVGFLLACVVFLSLPYLAGVFALILGVAAWEWSQLAGYVSRTTRGAFVVLALAGTAALFQYCKFNDGAELTRLQPLLGAACVWWAVALLWLKAYPDSSQLWGTRFMRTLMGLIVLLPTWLGFIYLFSRSGGMYLVLLLVVIVAAADIGAYFAGMRWGRHKLAAKVSPGKTWEGFWGGLAVSTVCALLIWLGVDDQRYSLIPCVVIAVSTALASVVGDLFVSMMKRHADVKDSGSILPGHGGILDRIDGMTAASPVFALGLILAGL